MPLSLRVLALCVLASAIQQHTRSGAQVCLVLLSFVALMALAAVWATAGSPLLLLRCVRAAAVVGAVSYLATVALYGPGSSGFYAARAYGDFVWIGMAVAVPLANRNRRGYVIPVLLFAASLLSLSRTATAACALQLIALAARNRTRGELGKLILFAAVTICGAFLLFTRFQPLRNRFIDNDGSGLAVGTSGRSRLWSITWNSIRDSPWTGHGIGSAERLISATLGPNRVTHPLNEYLRLWHDLGIIGLALWASAILILGHGAYRAWRTATNDADRAVHQAALLAIIGLSIDAITSNPLIYIYVMAPVAVIVGTSIGRANAVDRDDSSLDEFPCRKHREFHPGGMR